MKVTKEHVLKIASLARLKIPDEEIETYQGHLSEILTYVEKLNELDTENVPPTYAVHHAGNVFREDTNRPSLSQEDALKNAPSQSHGFFSVPKIINQE